MATVAGLFVSPGPQERPLRGRASACSRSRVRASRAARTRTRPGARCCSSRRSISTPSASSRERSARTSRSRAPTSSLADRPAGEGRGGAARDHDGVRSLPPDGRASGRVCAPRSTTSAGCSRTSSRAARSRSATRSCSLDAAAEPARRRRQTKIMSSSSVVRPPVEPAVERLDLEARLVEEAQPLGRREPVEAERRSCLARAHRERERPRALVPDRALEDPRLALEPAVVRLLDVLPARREHVEDEAPVRLEQRARGAQRAQLLRPPSPCAGGSGTGRSTSGTRSSTGGSRRSPRRRSSRSATPAASAGRAGDREHLGRGVDADHVDSGLGDRDRDAARPDRELDDRSAARSAWST